MGELAATGILLAAMAGIVLAFRLMVRRPVGVAPEDPPGVRTVAVFAGDDAEFFADDRPDELRVGNRLFEALCQGLAAGGIGIENRGTLDNAQRVECVVESERFVLVLEWFGQRWAASVEWSPTSSAEKRHLAWTHQVFAPPDSSRLRRLLVALDGWLKSQPKLSEVAWHRKEQWFADDSSSAASTPLAGEPEGRFEA